MTTHVAEPSTRRAITYLIAASWRTSKIAFALSLLETLGRVLLTLTPLFVGLLINALLTHNLPLLFLAAAGIASTQGIQFIVMTEGVQARLAMTDLLSEVFQRRIGELSGNISTITHLTDPDYQDQMQTLRERRGSLGMAFNMFVNVLNNGATPLVTFAVAWSADPRLLLLLLVAAPSLWAIKLSTRWDAAGEEESAAPGRLSSHLVDTFLAPTAAAELRVMGARHTIAQRAHTALRQWRSPVTKATTRSTLLSAAISTVYLLAAGAMMVWLTHDALAGEIDAGQIATAMLVIGQFRASVDSISWSMWGSARMVRASKRFLWLDDLAATDKFRHAGTAIVNAPLVDGVRLDDVTFTYPGADSPTFQGLSLHLPAGSTIAVVGENGAGKSTLVALLTGMYDVDSGVISVDGTPLPELDLPSWRAQCSGAFQDHLRLELTAREAVGLGDQHTEWSDQHIHAALSRGAATDVLTALPQGLDTQLGSDWPGGVGLSGGQWQRLAIARAMMRERALLLVLDEPTSALDPATEHRLFDGYAEAAHQTRANGGITVLVTHRFSTVTAADLVVVLDHGKVAEVGSHLDLLAAKGKYASLYELQAAGYR